MVACTRRSASASHGTKAKSLGTVRVEPAAWCMPSPHAPDFGINHLARRRERQHGAHRRAAAGRALDGDPAAECADAVLQADEAGAARRVGAVRRRRRSPSRRARAPPARPRRARPWRRRAWPRSSASRRRRSTRRLRRARAAAPATRTSSATGDRRAARERLERRPEAALGEDRRVDAERDLAQLVLHRRETLGDPRQLAVELGQLGRHGGLRGAELEPERDEPLLGAVVQVALELPPRLVGRGDDAGARRREVGGEARQVVDEDARRRRRRRGTRSAPRGRRAGRSAACRTAARRRSRPRRTRPRLPRAPAARRRCPATNTTAISWQNSTPPRPRS